MAGDANWASVALLLHGDGANGSTIFTDKGPSARAVTAVGNVQVSTAQSKFGGSAIVFDGVGDYLSLASDLAFSASTVFTMEAFVYVQDLTRVPVIFNKRLSTPTNSEYQCLVNSSGQVTATAWSAANAVVINLATAAGLVTTNAWYHLAWTRDSGGVWRIFVNGVLSASGTETAAVATNTQPLWIGHGLSSSNDFLGYMDEIRFTSGVARYTATFTPPTAQFQDGIGQVSGTVKDSTGAVAARTVRAYRRDTGALVANTASDVSGNYSFYTPTLDELTVMALDSATTGTIFNDLVGRVIPA